MSIFGSRSASLLRLDLHDHLYLHRRVGRQRRDADRRSGMTAVFAVEGNEQVGGAVYDLWRIAEAFGGIDEAEQLDDALDAVKVADYALDAGETADDGVLRGFVACL